MKTCNQCGAEKTLYDFYRKAGGAQGVSGCCKSCQDIKGREWAARNKNKVAAYLRKWRAENAAKGAEYHARWRRENPVTSRISGRRAESKWTRTHRGVANAKTARRVASVLHATPAWANPERIAKVYQLAARLTKETGVKYHVDHIVPLRSKIVSGLHVEYNLEAIPATKNISKGNRHWPDMPTGV